MATLTERIESMELRLKWAMEDYEHEVKNFKEWAEMANGMDIVLGADSKQRRVREAYEKVQKTDEMLRMLKAVQRDYEVE